MFWYDWISSTEFDHNQIPEQVFFWGGLQFDYIFGGRFMFYEW